MLRVCPPPFLPFPQRRRLSFYNKSYVNTNLKSTKSLVCHHSCCHIKDVQLYFHLLHLDFNVMADCCVTQWSVTSLTPLGHSSVIFAVIVLDHSQPRHHRCAFDLICLWSLISQRELQKGFIKFYPPIHPSSIDSICTFIANLTKDVQFKIKETFGFRSTNKTSGG